MKTLHLLAVTLAAASLGGAAMAAPTLDAAGKCRDGGKFVKTELCKSAKPDAGKCRDIKTKKFAKCGAPGTEKVPAK